MYKVYDILFIHLFINTWSTKQVSHIYYILPLSRRFGTLEPSPRLPEGLNVFYREKQLQLKSPL